MPMKHPPSHPGRVVRGSCTDPLGPIVTTATSGLCVSRQALTNLGNCLAWVYRDTAPGLALCGREIQVDRMAKTPERVSAVRKRHAFIADGESTLSCC